MKVSLAAAEFSKQSKTWTAMVCSPGGRSRSWSWQFSRGEEKAMETVADSKFELTNWNQRRLISANSNSTHHSRFQMFLVFPFRESWRMGQAEGRRYTFRNRDASAIGTSCGALRAEFSPVARNETREREDAILYSHSDSRRVHARFELRPHRLFLYQFKISRGDPFNPGLRSLKAV